MAAPCTRAVLAACALVAASAGLSLRVETTTGAYNVTYDGAPSWAAALVGGATAVRSGGRVHSTADGSLTLQGPATPTSGSDAFGAYTGYALSWLAGGTTTRFATNFYVYNAPVGVAPGTTAIVFEQVFPDGLTGCANGDVSDVVAAFPALGPSYRALATPLHYLAYQGVSLSSHVGQWTTAGVNSAYLGGSNGAAVVALMNASLATVVFSALTDHLTAYPSLAASAGGALTIGFNGDMAAVPAGYVFRSLLVAGQGVNDTMHAWGDLLLRAGGKPRTAR